MRNINISVVLYKNPKAQFLKVINSVLNTNLGIKPSLIGNSPTDDSKDLANIDNRAEYNFNNANPGYGKSHNIALRKSVEENVPYHLVLNPDVYFEKGVLEEFLIYIENNPDARAFYARGVLFKGGIQYLCKLLSTPIDLIFYRSLLLKKFKEKNL